jgi:hypothetical protein
MAFAESYVLPVAAELGVAYARRNELRETFWLRPGRITFDVCWGRTLNVKVVLKVWRADSVCERLLVDTDPYEVEWNRHKRVTRDFCVCPHSTTLPRITCAKFSFIVHLNERSIPSEFDYIFMDGADLDSDQPVRRAITRQWATTNAYHTTEIDPGILQRDADWYNRHFDSLRLTPKFTHGLVHHPYHPKRYIHDRIDSVIRQKAQRPGEPVGIKVCVDCIDDTDFVTHLLHARSCGVDVQCIVDWRKMTLTNSPNYARLRRSDIELLGVFCSAREPRVEVAPDMHMKFILFGQEDALHGSFNVTFDRWGANWESGMTFSSHGVCRLLDNIFQSIRGGAVQRYYVDPMSHFNLLYTFGHQMIGDGRPYRPHQAILSEIHRARRSIRLCLFLIGDMVGEYNDSVVDALIHAARRGVDVDIVVNGHVARAGDPGQEYAMGDELRRPLVPAVARLRSAGVHVSLAYGRHEQRVPYCPLHTKFCIIDHRIVLDGSFNWYNTSVFSHDLLVIAANEGVARAYAWEFDQTRSNLYYPAA